jgi:hypothetical protein
MTAELPGGTRSCAFPLSTFFRNIGNARERVPPSWPLQRLADAGDALRTRVGFLRLVLEGHPSLGSHTRGLDLLSARRFLQFSPFGTLCSDGVLFF